jgi:hypothetical protein
MHGLFKYCKYLQEITVNFDEWWYPFPDPQKDDEAVTDGGIDIETISWFDDSLPSTGIFRCPKKLIENTPYNELFGKCRIPFGWQIETF